MHIFKLMISIGGITLAFASPFSYAQFQSAAIGKYSGEQQSNASVKSRLLASRPTLSRDELGRVIRVTMPRGDFVQYGYNDQNQPVLDKTLLEGTTRDRDESLAYFAAQKRQQEYNLPLSGKSDLTSRHFAKNASPALDQTSRPGGGSCNISETACIPNADDFFDECARNPVCLGFMDDVNSFIGNLANWLEVGVGVGATYGTVTAIAQGSTTAAAILESAGLFGIAGGAVVLAFGGGYLIGMGLNAGGEALYSWVFTKEGQLIPLENYLAAYTGDNSRIGVCNEAKI